MKFASYKEPLIPNYIYVNPETNTVHLLPPMVRGNRIGMDNTCKSLRSMGEFFGFYKYDGDDPRHVAKPALAELEKYKLALEHDIKLDLIPFLTAQKRKRLEQIDLYIKALKAMKQNSYSLSDLNHDHPRYPVWMLPLLSTKTNLFSMLLRPEIMDGYTRFENSVIFSIGRGSYRSALSAAMHSEYASLIIKSATISSGQQNPRERLTQAVVQSQAGKVVNFRAIQNALTTQAKGLFNVDVDFRFTVQVNSTFAPNGTFISQTTSKIPVTQTYIDELMGFDETATVKDYVDALLGSCAQELWDTLTSSSFSIQNDQYAREKMSILTQFFLAELNIYCYANDLSTANFGKVIEKSLSLSGQIPKVVKAALASGKSVERALFDLINTHGQQFGLSAPLDDTAFNQVREDFESDYKTISKSPHFDEFVVLVDKPGVFKTHQGAICIDFARLITLFPQKLDNAFFAQVREEELPHTVPHKNEFVNEISDEVLFGLLIDSVAAGDILKASNWLLSVTENKQQVFERLDDSTTQTLMCSFYWDELRRRIENSLAQQPAGLNKFHNHFKTTTITINNRTAASLYYAATADQGFYDPEQKPEFTTSDFKQLLEERHELSHIMLIEKNAQGFLITAPHQQSEQFAALLQNYEKNLYCTSMMLNAFYAEAIRLHGEESPQIRRIEKQLDSSSKLSLTLELLRIPVQQITIPEGKEYIIIHGQSSTALTMMLNILRYPTLSPAEQMSKFNAALGKLELQAAKLGGKAKYKVAHDAARELIADLTAIGENYFLNKRMPYTEFKNQCQGAIRSKRAILAEHHGWDALLAGFLYVVNTLIYTVTLFTTSNFFKMAPTDSAREIDCFQEGLETAFNEESGKMSIGGA